MDQPESSSEVAAGGEGVGGGEGGVGGEEIDQPWLGVYYFRARSDVRKKRNRKSDVRCERHG